jgi:hypothetical protein
MATQQAILPQLKLHRNRLVNVNALEDNLEWLRTLPSRSCVYAKPTDNVQ